MNAPGPRPPSAALMASASLEARLQAALQMIPAHMWYALPSGTWIFVNERTANYLGLPQDHPLRFGIDTGASWDSHMSLLHPDDHEEARKAWSDCLRREAAGEVTFRVRNAEGGCRWFSGRAEPLRADDGTLLYWIGINFDIHERKQAEFYLAEGQRLAHMGSWVFDSGGFSYWSPELFEIYGLDPAANAPTIPEYMKLVHPEDREIVTHKIQTMLADQRDFEFLKRIVRPDGATRYVRCVGTGASIIHGLVGTAMDVTEHEELTQALRTSEEKFRLVVDGIAALVAAMTPEGDLEFVSKPALEYFGRTPEYLRVWRNNDTVHPDDLARTLAVWADSVQTEHPFEIDYRLRRADGVYRWFHAHGRPSRDAHGRIVRWYLVLTDIEERKKAEQQLAEHERDLRKLVEQLRRSEAFLAEGQYLGRMGNFSWIVATDEIKWSEPLYRIFAFEPGATITLDLIGSRVHPEDLPVLSDMIDNGRRATSDLEYTYRILMPDGSIKHLHMVAHAHPDDDGRLEYIGAVQDITQRRMSEDALAKARSELANISRITSMGVLAASIAHEVNQPLSGIITNASTCLRMLSADHPNVDGARETARRTIRDGNRAADVITRLRALYTKKDLALEPMDLNEITREVTSLLLSDLQRNRVVLYSELAEDLPPITADRIQLQQVILNLVRNASDAMSTIDGRPRELLIRTERDEGEQVRLSVRDTGIGFATQAADKCFEPFYTTKITGMGVGLFLSRSIIEAHQGRLWATPNDGPGATFSFSIPARSVSRIAQAAGAN